MTSQQLQMSLFEESEVSTLSVEDFRARLFQLQESDKVSRILEELSSLKLQGSHLFSDQAIYSLRTSKDSLITKEGLRSRQSSEPWMNSGMMWNGKCLTLRTTFHKTGSEFSLSDILEEQVPKKIFPFGSDDSETDRQYRIKKIGNIRKKGSSQSGDVVSIDSISPTMCSTTTQKDPLKIAIPVLTPDRAEKRQNGRRFKEDGEEMFTLTAQDRHGIMIAGKLPGNHDQNSRVYNSEGLAPTLSTMQGGGQEPKILIKEATSKGYTVAEPGDGVNISHPNSKTRRGRVGKKIVNTLVIGEKQGVVTEELHIRKLTPRECWRLQTFPDWAFDRAAAVNSASQLYKQAGNSVTVAVIFDIARRLKLR